MGFLFEKLSAYQKSLVWNNYCKRCCEKYAVSTDLKRQLFRAASSVALNVAEANGRVNRKERRYHYSVARGSLFECLAIWHLLEGTVTNPNDYSEGEKIIRDVGSFLNGTIGELNVSLMHWERGGATRQANLMAYSVKK